MAVRLSSYLTRSIDNIVIERFFRTLKHGNIYISDYQSIKELKEGVKAHMHKYNFKRFHSAIGYQKPMNYYLEFIKSVELIKLKSCLDFSGHYTVQSKK